MDEYVPSGIKSCRRCRLRKVKCSACEKQGEVCDITDHVAYSYALVESLHLRVKELEASLAACKDNSAYTQHTAEPSTNPPSGIDGKSAPLDASKEAEEVGILAIGYADRYSQAKYVGAAAGSTFARIFFKQVGMKRADTRSENSDNEDDIMACTASIPPKAISEHLLCIYIASVHLWWPFLDLRHIRSCFRKIYQMPQKCTHLERFTFFMILALAADEAHHDQSFSSRLDYNTSHDYLKTALHFFDRFCDHPRDLSGLHAALLITIWMLNSPSCKDSNDIWHLTRYNMSIALELGLHRHNPAWRFSSEELEMRSRTWWTVYSLERFVALNTGRVLSVRDQAIDTALPSPGTIDQLTEREAKIATLFHAKSVWLFALMIELRKIAGRILESIYIARDGDGRCSTLTFQDVCSITDDLHRQLDRWKGQLDAADIESSREGRLMKIEYYTMLMHLNRPSPAFMIPSQNMVAVCSHASSGALYQWAAILSEFGINAVCRCYRHFHDILMAGLVRLYSDWHMQRIAPTSGSVTRPEDAALCLDLLSKGIANINDRSLAKFQIMFSRLKDKVYGFRYAFDEENHNPFSQPAEMPMSAAGPAIVRDQAGSADFPSTEMDIMPLGTEGREDYLSQMSTIFENDMLDIDDTLTAWYGSVLNDIGDTGSMRMG